MPIIKCSINLLPFLLPQDRRVYPFSSPPDWLIAGLEPLFCISEVIYDSVDSEKVTLTCSGNVLGSNSTHCTYSCQVKVKVYKIKFLEFVDIHVGIAQMHWKYAYFFYLYKLNIKIPFVEVCDFVAQFGTRAAIRVGRTFNPIKQGLFHTKKSDFLPQKSSNA